MTKAASSSHFHPRPIGGAKPAHGPRKKASVTQKKRKRKKSQKRREQSGLSLTINGRTLGDSTPRRLSEPHSQVPVMSAEDTEALLGRWMKEVWCEGKLETIDELFSPSGANHEKDFPIVSGRDAFKRHVIMIRSAFPDIQVNIENFAQSGPQAVVRWNAEMTFYGPFQGQEPTNQHITSSGISFFNIRGGLIQEIGSVRGESVVSDSSPEQLKKAKQRAKEVAKIVASLPPAFVKNGASVNGSANGSSATTTKKSVKIVDEIDLEPIAPFVPPPPKRSRRGSHEGRRIPKWRPDMSDADSQPIGVSSKNRAILRKKTPETDK